MAEIFVSAYLPVVLGKLLSPELINFVRREGVHSAIKKWKKKLVKIQAVLSDAEEKQITTADVKIWLDELRDLAYDVDDILDEFATEALRLQVMAEPQAGTSRIRSLIPACCTSLEPRAFMFNFRMESKIGAITSRLQDISTQKTELNLVENAGRMSNRTRDRPVNESSSAVESHVYGREKDKEAILELLFRVEASDGVVGVIPIIAMGGVGKTTLANLVYNDHSVKDYFDLQAWVCVSDQESDFVRVVTKAILESFTLSACDVNSLDSLQQKLQEKLSKKKFLLVLDDVWHEDYDEWTKLRRPLDVAEPGSKIIVTARNQAVSHAMGTTRAVALKELSNDDCLSIFTQHALGTGDFSSHPHLKQIGEKIVKRCKGLPLAAKVLGGLLRTTRKLDQWEGVLHSQLWNLQGGSNKIIPALRLSYHHLPPRLKQCFAYCSILPKDYEFKEEELVLLWMAEGLLQQCGKGKQMEDIGAECFRDLLSRSFFQPSTINESQFIMHDLINDLAQCVAGETYFRLEDKLELRISEKVRHSSYVSSYFDGVERFKAFDVVVCNLRTFLPLMTPRGNYLTNRVTLNLLPKLRCLRVLSLSGYCTTELPESIGDLKHLRYLNFSGTKIRSLPSSMCTLYNLQTLILKDCSCLKKLPTTMGNLINLRHLDITNANLINEMPMGVGQLTRLQKLSNFIVGNGSGSKIRDLINLKHLQGRLCISRLENVTDAQDAGVANLRDKQNLKALTMEWSSEFDDSRNNEVEKYVLDILQPHKNLEELVIKCYGGVTLPTWVGNPSFSQMVLLKLENCVKCTSLPSLGQLPLLKDLYIRGMKEVKTVGPEFIGRGYQNRFPSLELLSFEEMQEWERWFPLELEGQVEVFFHLRKLSIKRCPKLSEELPNHFPSLKKLVIDECPQVAVSISSLPEHCELNIWEDHQEVVKGSISALKSLILCNISKVPHLTQGFEQGLRSVEDLKIVGSDELTTLCQKVGLQHHLTSLRHLEIKACPKFVSLVAEEAEQQQGLPCRLESLILDECKNLEKLQGLHTLTSLRQLTIKNCNSVTSIARDQLPSTLKKLEITSCMNLLCIELEGEGSTFSSSLMMHMSNNNGHASLLESLSISLCDSLISLSSKGKLPATLKNLRIWNCPKLVSVADSLYNNTSLETIEICSCESLKSLPDALDNLIHLSCITILDCPSLEDLFPKGGLLSTTLRQLCISNCEKLKALPGCMHHLTSLQELMIVRCPGIVSFPKKGFPTNLTELEIKDLNICEPLFEWGLHRLTSLTRIKIEGGCPNLVSFPKEDRGMMLPTSLATLSINDFPNLEHLSFKGLQNLTSLKHLVITKCPNLNSLLEERMLPSLCMGFQNLTSLEKLSISDCPKLKSFPEEGLPPSLLQLYIYNCPLLKKRCKKDQGRDWPKICHIPYVQIDGKFIFEPEDEED